MIRLVAVLLAFIAAPAAAQAPLFQSQLQSLRITRTAALPAGPRQQLHDYCRDKVVAPRGAGARAVAGRGWHVTGEAPLGRLVAVSFVASLEPGTSGICLVDGGNVALFGGPRLLAIVHARGEAALLRRITRTPVPGRLRIWSEEYTPPIADIVARGGGAAVVPIADREIWCGGVALPNIYGLRIGPARRRLLAAGWRPAPPPAADIADVTGGRDFDFRRAGVTEVEVCSGTGFGLCLFNYRHPRGARLQVQTAGEEESVVDRGVTCGTARRRR